MPLNHIHWFFSSHQSICIWELIVILFTKQSHLNSSLFVFWHLWPGKQANNPTLALSPVCNRQNRSTNSFHLELRFWPHIMMMSNKYSTFVVLIKEKKLYPLLSCEKMAASTNHRYMYTWPIPSDIKEQLQLDQFL